jgi:hypothetical protein
VAEVLLAAAACALCLAAAATALLLWRQGRPTRLEELSRDDRARLVRDVERITPLAFQPFPASGPLMFYHLRPLTPYVEAMGDTFVSNDLGFRAIPTRAEDPRRRKLVIVGDSWTFGPHVKREEAFPGQLETLLHGGAEEWEVYSLSMPGWNAQNEVAALRAFFSRLAPDLVVICPTSNDIDDSLDVWNGGLVIQGFTSRAVFRRSFEYERRWIETFGLLQRTVDWLEEQGVGSLVYFLAEWRGLAPYYASLAGFDAPYTVAPTDYTDERFRLPRDVDPGRHSSVEGHRLLASYLYDALLASGLVRGREPIDLPMGHEVTFPGQSFGADEVEAEFDFWLPYATERELLPEEGDFIGRRGIFGAPSRPQARHVVVRLHLLDEPGLYPLTVNVRLASPESVEVTKTFPAPPPIGTDRVVLSKPDSLDRYRFVEVFIDADRAVSTPDRELPVTMRVPRIRVE